MISSALDSVLFWNPYQSVKAAVEIVKNWWPVAKEISCDEPQTWGGKNYKLLGKCGFSDVSDVNDVLDCVSGQ